MWEFQESVNDRLTGCGVNDGGFDPNYDYYISNLRGGPHTYDVALHTQKAVSLISDDRMQEDLKWFNAVFQSEILKAIELYGRGSVHTDWGLLTWCG